MNVVIPREEGSAKVMLRCFPMQGCLPKQGCGVCLPEQGWGLRV